MVQLHNSFFFIISMFVPCGTTSPALWKWFISREILIDVPSSNGTIISIPIPSFPLLVYLHSKKFVRFAN
ncbi:unnamed protein product, partial [Vitis vinifera]|uniref:Uncharacterized protein n=1 Tax=Vitis vinifera TaxID=29760 RepID=D7TPZ1_VITVI